MYEKTLCALRCGRGFCFALLCLAHSAAHGLAVGICSISGARTDGSIRGHRRFPAPRPTACRERRRRSVCRSERIHHLLPCFGGLSGLVIPIIGADALAAGSARFQSPIDQWKETLARDGKTRRLENSFGCCNIGVRLRRQSPCALHEPSPLIPSFSPNGGEGARRAVEGDSDRFMVPMHAKKRKEALHVPERSLTSSLSPTVGYLYSGVRPSSAAATWACSSGSDCPNATGSPCVSAPEDGRTPLNTYRGNALGDQPENAQGLKAQPKRTTMGAGLQPSIFWGTLFPGLCPRLE